MQDNLLFDAMNERWDWSAGYENNPVGLVLFLWEMEAHDRLSIEDLCELALVDPDAYVKLWRWAQGAQALPDAAKARLFDILVVKGKPRRNKKAIKDARLRMIADILVRDYGLTRTSSTGGTSAADVIAEALDMNERTLERTIRPQVSG